MKMYCIEFAGNKLKIARMEEMIITSDKIYTQNQTFLKHSK